MQEKLGTLAMQLDIITRRIRTLGLARAADDLVKVVAELRRLERVAKAPADVEERRATVESAAT